MEVSNRYTFSKVNYEDPALFENRSFTVSYDPILKNWISYHSYLPVYYIPSTKDYFKLENSIIYKPNPEKYDEDMPFILEVVFNEDPKFTKVFDSFSWEVESESSNSFNNDFFDELLIYNESQISGIIPVEITGNNKNVTKKEKNWNFNKFLDESVSSASKKLFNTDWDSLKNSYFIDKVINPNSIDNNKPWYLKGRFRDKFVVIRFKYSNKNLENNKIICNFVTSNYRVSHR